MLKLSGFKNSSVSTCDIQISLNPHWIVWTFELCTAEISIIIFYVWKIVRRVKAFDLILISVNCIWGTLIELAADWLLGKTPWSVINTQALIVLIVDGVLMQALLIGLIKKSPQINVWLMWMMGLTVFSVLDLMTFWWDNGGIIGSKKEVIHQSDSS